MVLRSRPPGHPIPLLLEGHPSTSEGVRPGPLYSVLYQTPLGNLCFRNAGERGSVPVGRWCPSGRQSAECPSTTQPPRRDRTHTYTHVGTLVTPRRSVHSHRRTPALPSLSLTPSTPPPRVRTIPRTVRSRPIVPVWNEGGHPRSSVECNDKNRR